MVVGRKERRPLARSRRGDHLQAGGKEEDGGDLSVSLGDAVDFLGRRNCACCCCISPHGRAERAMCHVPCAMCHVPCQVSVWCLVDGVVYIIA